MARGIERMADQLMRSAPVESHATLGCVHGFSYAKTEIPQIFAKSDGTFPIDVLVEPRVVVC